MIPLLKIRLHKIKNNPFKQIIQYSLPLVYIIWILIILYEITDTRPSIDPPQDSTSTLYSLFDLNVTHPTVSGFEFSNRSYGIISKDKQIQIKMKEYFDALKVSDRFTIYDSYEAYYNGTYFNSYSVSFAFEVNKNEQNEYQCQVYIDQFDDDRFMNSYNVLYETATLTEYGIGILPMFYTGVLSQLLMHLEGKEPTNNYVIKYMSFQTYGGVNSFSYELPNYVIFGLLAFFYYFTCISMMLWMIEEKEHKLTLFLFRQGMTNKSYILSWFVIFCVLSMPIAIIMSIILVIYYFVGINIIWLFITFILFLVNLFSYSFFFHSLFDKSQDATVISKISYLAICAFSFIINSIHFPYKFRILFLFFPQINISTVLSLIISFGGINVDLITKITALNGGVCILYCYVMFILSSLFFFGFGIFIMKYKQSKLPLSTFICNLCTTTTTKQLSIIDQEDKTNQLLITNNNNFHQEPNQYQTQSKADNTHLHIDKVTKQYGDLIAVNEFEGDLYPGEIFCLLGHNGAGKTTLIKILSGGENPNSGDIYMDNISLITNKNYLFKHIGICSQENIFFDYLTVEQHISLMYELKGGKVNIIEMNDLITKLGLNLKAKWLTKELSGGDKRKLCVALALIGQSKLILLDEPTSGMDIVSKRVLWDFLKGYRQNKIIILTTHSIDEAEYLGDRIGIMLEGKYYCSGTSTFLKSKLSKGYTINLILDSSRFTREMVNQLYIELKQIDQTAEIKYQSMFMLSMYFKTINEQVNAVFSKLSELKNNFPIVNYTMSSTTLEEVFLFVNVLQNEPNVNGVLSLNDSIPITNESQNIQIADKTPPSCCGQIYLNIKRQCISFWRNKLSFFIEIFSSLMLFLVIIFIFILSYLTIRETNERDFTDLLEINNAIHYKFFEGTTVDSLKSSYYYKSASPILNFNYFDIEPTDINNPDTLITKNNNKTIRNSIFLNNINNTTHISIATSFSNKFAFHADMNMLLSYLFERDYGIKASFSPVIKLINTYHRTQSDTTLLEALLFILLSCITLISFGTYLLTNLIKERQNNIVHLYYLSGGNMCSYWISNLILDILKYCILVFIIILLSPIGHISFASNCFIGISIVSCCLYTYLFSYMFNTHEDGNKMYMTFNLVCLVLLPLLIDINASSGYFRYVTVSDFLPFTALFSAIIRFEFLSVGYYGFYIVIKTPIVFIIQCVVYTVLIMLCEKKVFQKWYHCICKTVYYVFSSSSNNLQQQQQQQTTQRTFNEELLSGDIVVNACNNIVKDYNKEQQDKIALDTDKKQLSVKISGLSKIYYKCCCCNRSIKAVNNLYIGLNQNEKLGLLGYNGSGKTTVFKSLINEIMFDGNISIFGYNNKSQFKQIRKSIGYCPQENALFDYLTVNDMLLYFQKLRNVHMSIDDILKTYDLIKYRNTLTTHLSGGNKRKLLFAIALIDNNSELLLLDEPSTGVDPKSRRKMWENINRLSSNKNFNMILSTHSMEEAEILCDTVSWLRDGQLICLGNPEQLKLAHSMGYILHIKFNEDDNVFEGDDDIIRQVSTVFNIAYDRCLMYVKDIPKVLSYLRKILSFYESVHTKVSKCTLIDIRRDLSFEIVLNIIESMQSELFAQILTMKESSNDIAELTISMVPLENIFTKM